MAARAIELRNAVADILEATTFSFRFLTRRMTYGVHPLESTNITLAYVYPGTYFPGEATRGSRLRTFTVIVHLVNFLDSVTPTEQSEIEKALEMAEEIEQALDGTQPDGFQMSGFTVEQSGKPPFEVERATTDNSFHTLIEVTYIGTLQ